MVRTYLQSLYGIMIMLLYRVSFLYKGILHLASITFFYSTCISSFFGSSIPTSLFIFLMFFVLVIYKLCSTLKKLRSGIQDHTVTYNVLKWVLLQECGILTNTRTLEEIWNLKYFLREALSFILNTII